MLIMFLEQPHRVFQHFPSDLLNSAIPEANVFEIGEEKSMSAYGDMELYLRMTSTVPLFTNFYENVLV